MKVHPGYGSTMKLWPPGDLLDDLEEEWKEVPIYTGIKQLAGPWVEDGFDIHAEGADNVPEDDGVIVASNHASWFDPVFLGAAVDRPIRWMAKAELFRHPVLDFFFSKAGQVKVDRVSGGNQAAVDRCVELTREGRVVGIFPEGTRSINGAVRRGKTGVARVALRSGKPVVPVAMNSYDVLPKHAKMPNIDQPLVVQIGEPLVYEDMQDMVEDRNVCRKVTDEIMGEVARLLERARTRRESLVLADGG